MDEEDALQYMYIDECRILLPTGKVIYLMDKNITLHYVYYESRKVTGEKYKIIQNVQPQYINNKKIVYMDGVFEGDNAGIIFNANIPSSVNSLQVEYTLTMVWEERGETKQRYSGRFEKESHKYYWFTH
ncbi:hypothetical protein FACS189491_11330 [Spirochaetia bacterium]|nr:hypothetical protein FACS189491_11330 [Spirochaetia bacterium]